MALTPGFIAYVHEANANSVRGPLSPRGRGREAMTYGRARHQANTDKPLGADVSHLAGLVRGDFSLPTVKAPSSGPSGHLLPKERRGSAARIGVLRQPLCVVGNGAPLEPGR
jgi:hypothetical protein